MNSFLQDSVLWFANGRCRKLGFCSTDDQLTVIYIYASVSKLLLLYNAVLVVTACFGFKYIDEYTFRYVQICQSMVQMTTFYRLETKYFHLFMEQTAEKYTRNVAEPLNPLVSMFLQFLM